MVNLRKVMVGLLATTKAVWKGGSPFAALTALWPTNEEGKYTIESEGIKFAFTNHGAAVANLWLKDKNGEEIDVVLGLNNADMYENTESNPYLNGIIGRYAGYISGASYEADGVEHQITANAYGNATLNGGDQGWGRLDWAVPSNEKDSIVFVMFDKGKNGFPGLFISCITHTVTPHEWHIEYGVTPLLMPGGPINVAQQVFFNLDGLRKGTDGTIGSIAHHGLHLPMSGMRFDFDDRGIGTGNILSNRKGEEHDFWSNPKNIKDALSSGLYDETFMVAHKYADYSRRTQPVAILSSERSGISMEVFTDQDAIRVRTWDDELNGPLNLKQNQGEGRVPQSGAISVEKTEWPDAVSHPEWMNRKNLWGNLDIYTGYMAYKFKMDRKQEAARDPMHQNIFSTAERRLHPDCHPPNHSKLPKSPPLSSRHHPVDLAPRASPQT